VTQEQIKLLNKLELALANMIYDRYIYWANCWAIIIEHLRKGESAVAVLEAENLMVDKEVLEEIRKTFDIRY
jgi:hypothetical protein